MPAGSILCPAGQEGSMISLTGERWIDDSEVTLAFVRSSGPGGQNVNKVATAVELRFDALSSPSLTEAEKARLFKLAGRRATEAGVIVIDARRYRTQERNRQDALSRLVALLRAALVAPPRRVPTSPTPRSNERRIREKKLRGALKKDRGAE